mgnify:FL=1
MLTPPVTIRRFNNDGLPESLLRNFEIKAKSFRSKIPNPLVVPLTVNYFNEEVGLRSLAESITLVHH